MFVSHNAVIHSRENKHHNKPKPYKHKLSGDIKVAVAVQTESIGITRGKHGDNPERKQNNNYGKESKIDSREPFAPSFFFYFYIFSGRGHSGRGGDRACIIVRGING